MIRMQQIHQEIENRGLEIYEWIKSKYMVLGITL
jgi:hypothetical protein